MEATPDLSKIIGLIMENPEIIDGIKNLMRVEGAKEAAGEEAVTEPMTKPTEEYRVESVSAAPHSDDTLSKKKKRNTLLKSLRPFVSDSRAGAIDTIIGFMDVIDVIGRG